MAVKNNFQENSSHKCSTLALVRLFVAAAATVYEEPHFWRTEGQELLHLWVTKTFFAFESIATHELNNNEIQFLEFMDGSNLTLKLFNLHAFCSNKQVIRYFWKFIDSKSSTQYCL